MRYALLFVILFLPVQAFSQNDSCSCFSLRPFPDLYTGTFAQYTKYNQKKPYTGICHVYYMKVAYKIPDYTRTYQYGRFDKGELQFWIQYNEPGDTLAYFHRVKHDSVFAESRQFNYQTGTLESKGIYYYTGMQKRLKSFGYRADGILISETNYFFPDAQDSLNYGDSFINYHQDAQLGSDGFYNTPVQDGPFIEYGGKDGLLVVTRGAYHNNSKSGKWTTWYDSGQKESEGSYSIHNWKDSNWKEWYSDGRLKSDIQYCNSNPCGSYKEWYDNGSQKTERYYKGVLTNGIFNEYWENGNLKRRETYEDGHRLKTESWFSNGQESWKNSYSLAGNPVGTHQSWYENGKLRDEAHYDSLGNHDAPEREYYSNGVLQREIFYENNMCSEERRYYESGKLKSEEPYAWYSKNGTCTYYYPSGKINRQIIFANGRKEGNSKTYSEDGTLMSEINYRNDEWDGPCQWFFPGGKPYRLGHYSASVRNGLFREWNENGVLVYEQSYQNGVPMDERRSPLQNFRFRSDSLRTLYKQDVEVMAGGVMNSGDTTFSELLAESWMKERMLSDLLSIAAYIPAQLDSVMLVHSDSSQRYTHIFLDYPQSKLKKTDTSSCDSWPAQLDRFVNQLHLKLVPGECYGDDNAGIRRGFTSELFFNGAVLDAELKKLNPRFGCEYFSPANSDSDPHNSAIRVTCSGNFYDYSFYIISGPGEWMPAYTQWTFRVYPDGSVDYLQDRSGHYGWEPPI